MRWVLHGGGAVTAIVGAALITACLAGYALGYAAGTRDRRRR